MAVLRLVCGDPDRVLNLQGMLSRKGFQVMQELMDEDPQIFLPYEDGSLRPLCLGELLQEKLFHRTLK